MMRWRDVRLWAVGVVAMLLGSCAAAPAVQVRMLSAEAGSAAGSAARAPAAEVFSIPVIEVAGDARGLGASYGRQLNAPIHELYDRYLMSWFKSETQRFMAMAAANAFSQHLSDAHREEAYAVAEATGIAPGNIFLGQCFLDLLPMTACSSISLPASASPDGVARLARNLDFPSLGVADRYSTVLIFKPEGRYAFAAVSWPGLLGVLSGMNEHGLVLVNMEVTRSRRLPQAMPYTYLYRTVLEECRTVDEAIELLQRTPRQTANNLMLMDAAGNRAVVELQPESVAVRRGQGDAPLISTNHQRGDNQSSTGRCQRYDSLLKAAADFDGQADVHALQRALADVQQGDLTLQSMIFEPATRTLYLATGKRAAEQQMHRLDLRQFFEE